MKAQCKNCPAGFYCKNKVSQLVKCPARHYCPERTEIPKSCPNGTFTYDNDTGLETAGDCRPCIPGSYCKSGLFFFN